MSKGSTQRPGNREKYAANWERIFGGGAVEKLTVGHYASHTPTGASLVDARPSPCAECERLRAEAETLREALDDFGQHDAECLSRQIRGGKFASCDCGLDAALAAGRGE